MNNFSKSKVVSLTGGLGNQLFQLAAGLYAAGENQLILTWKFGKPRLNNLGEPEITSLQLPHKVNLDNISSESQLASKAVGYILRQGVSPRIYEKIPGVKDFTRLGAEIITSYHFRKRVQIHVADGVGYDSIDPQGNKNLFVGYFQSYRWLESPDVRKKMHSLRLVKPSPKILKYLQLANVEAPLVVHFRFGDYKNEHSFGIPHSNYYKVAIERELSTNKYNKVWVFSDEPILAASVLKFLPPSIIRWIPEIDNSASQTFEVMRFGNGYIIANSTFSWWGAMLSYNKNSNVIAPFPWFRKLQIPLDLIPKDWALVNAWNTGQN